MSVPNADEPITFTMHDLSELNSAARILKHAGIKSRFQLVKVFDKNNGVTGLNGIGPFRTDLLKRAVSAGPGRWSQLTQIIPAFATPEEIGSDIAGAVAAGIRQAPDKLFLMFAADSYSGGGANDYRRAFYTKQDAFSEAAKLIEGGPEELEWIHLAELATFDGSMRIIARGEFENSDDYAGAPPVWTWTEPTSGAFGSAFGAPAGTQATFTEMEPAVDGMATVQTIGADPHPVTEAAAAFGLSLPAPLPETLVPGMGVDFVRHPETGKLHAIATFGGDKLGVICETVLPDGQVWMGLTVQEFTDLAELDDSTVNEKLCPICFRLLDAPEAANAE